VASYLKHETFKEASKQEHKIEEKQTICHSTPALLEPLEQSYRTHQRKKNDLIY
jgi:hypothetical protein